MNQIITPSTIGEQTTSLLLKSFDRSVPSLGEPLFRDAMLQRFDTIAQAHIEVQGGMTDDFALAYDISTQFVHTAFDVFEHKAETDRFDWTFAVPARGEESQGEEYASEVTFFLPLLDPKFGVNSMVRQRTVAHLAPAIIETYKGNETGARGALIWTPAYLDPQAMNDRVLRVQNAKVAQYRISEAAGFISHTLGAKIMGLGAIMPGLTNSGKTIRQEGLITTTGHGGTVYLVAETVREVAERQQQASRIGVLGLGAIGYSSLEVLRESANSFNAQSFVVYDIEADLVMKAVNSNKENIPTMSARNIVELLEMSDIIVTAVTKPVDLDALELEIGRPLNFTGKTIIDDSQPGCFERSQVEARGGTLAWVVGEDTTAQHAFMRTHNYSYGDSGGLYGERAVWGCEAEAGSISMSKSYESAVNTRVSSEIARKVGKICFDSGIRVSRPLQSFGQPVDI